MKCRPLTKKEMKREKKMSECPLCEKEFTNKNPLVEHHDHISGEFLDFVCLWCNLQLKPHQVMARKRIDEKEDWDTKYLLPVVCHNMKGYDSHHILKSLGKI